MKKYEKFLGKEVKVTLKNGVNYYGILQEIISESDTEEIYINSSGNIMGILQDKIKCIVENV